MEYNSGLNMGYNLYKSLSKKKKYMEYKSHTTSKSTFCILVL